MNNKPLLLSLLAVLFVLRFVVVPIFDWQNATIEETNSLQNKLDKSAAYIDDLPKLRAFGDELTAALAARHQASETYNDIGRYQIAKQRQFEQMFTANNIEIRSSNWLDPIATAKGVTLQLRLQFSGQVNQFIQLHTQIAALGDSVHVTNLSLTMSGQTPESLGTFSGNAIIRFMPLESPDAVN
ncbi:hypothetical protein [Shewanella sp. UCD-KL12]|uniref:hypothetical protein n=1 Tax=Shewanella sp. UCD-KL12 TaxID=1917163 RepID=UPI00097060F8|nr:hypothetical protein [Shewanella sp. UCD-KL12]